MILANKPKIYIGAFLLFLAVIVTSAFFVFHNQKSLANDGGSEENILVGNKYVFPKLEKSFPSKEPKYGSQAVKGKKLMVPILMYHYIEATPPGSKTPTLFTEPDIFENQLKTLQETGYHMILPRELGKYLRDEGSLPTHPAMVSFDDGYDDFYTNVFPILKRYNAKAVLYVIVNFMDKPGFITGAQAKEMSDSGLVEIDSHTLDHANLSRTPEKEAIRQVTESKEKLSKIIGAEVTGIAYPFGLFTYRDERLVRQAGYLTAASTYIGTMQSIDRVYSLYRLRPGKKVNGDFIKWLNNAESK